MKYINLRDQNEPHFTMLCNKYYNCLNNYCSLLHLALLGSIYIPESTTFDFCQMVIQCNRWIYDN